MATKPACFDTVDLGAPASDAPVLKPWKKIPLDPEYSGAWVVAADINQDGKVEIVSARNVDRDDVHYTSAVVAQDVEGNVLWRWGNPDIGRRGLHHDVACQIHDWDGDGQQEVIVSAEDCLVELDGATGEERRRVSIPRGASDCLVFADLSGRGRASEILIKTRYTRIWALNYAGKQLWTIENPGGFPTAHQPVPLDLDGDGRDEIVAGYAMLNPDGQVRWVLPDGGRFSGSGHLDCCRVLRRGETPAAWCLVLACCGHNRLMAVDGNGGVRWEIVGHHFESIDIGRIFPERAGTQIFVDLVPQAAGPRNYELWVVDEDGSFLGRLTTDYGRFHTLVDLNGDGGEKIVLSHSRGLVDCRGQRIATFAMESQADLYDGRPVQEGEIGNIVLRGNLSGHGGKDILITAPHAVYIFRGAAGRGPAATTPLGCGTNVTLY